MAREELEKLCESIIGDSLEGNKWWKVAPWAVETLT